MTYELGDVVTTTCGTHTYSIRGLNYAEKLYDDFADGKYVGKHNLSFYESELRLATPEEVNKLREHQRKIKCQLD